MQLRRVVVTGLGAVTPLGIGMSELSDTCSYFANRSKALSGVGNVYLMRNVASHLWKHRTTTDGSIG